MIKSIAIYIEGGGDSKQTLVPFRSGMSAFLKPVVDAARAKRIQWRVIPCGGRKQAYDAFVDAVEHEPEVYNVLLVDGEEPVAITALPWDHLKQRLGDQWSRPETVTDEQCHLMVVAMEAWFLADPEALKTHFGGRFDISKLPAADLAESRGKDAMAQALKQATRDTRAGAYKKIRDGARLLATVNTATVRAHCKWCDRLFVTLLGAIGENA